MVEGKTMSRYSMRSTRALAPLLLACAGAALAAPVRTSDFFAPDKALTRSVVRLLDALRRAERPDHAAAQQDLEMALVEVDDDFAAARANSAGPFTGGGNPEREKAAAIQILRSMAHRKLEKQNLITRTLKGLVRPPPRFTATEIAGIPMVERGDPSRPVVALTFDDGPQPPYSTRVLDVLAKHGVPATFFVVGQMAKKNPKILQRIHQEGHELAHHSWSHPRMTELQADQIRVQIEKTDAVFADVLPRLGPITMFRLPFQVGSKSKRVQAELAKRYDYLIDWTVDSKDYQNLSAKQLYEGIRKQSRKNGAIILFHDRRPQTAEAVDLLIADLRLNGFGFATVSEIMGTDLAGRRLDSLVEGIGLLLRGRFKEAARTFGNFTLKYPDSPAAPVALYASYQLAEWLSRPKAGKLKEALVKRFPESLVSKFVQGQLASWQEFQPGGQTDVRSKRGLPPIKETLEPVLPEADPADPFAGLEPVEDELGGGGGAPPPAEPAPEGPPVLPSVASGARPPPPPSGARPPPPVVPPPRAKFPGRVHPAQALRLQARRGKTYDNLELFQAEDPTPLPDPFYDPQPRLDGSHMIDPRHF